MIFLQIDQKPPGMFLLITDKDIQTIIRGQSIFVNQSQLQGKTFQEVIIGYAKDDNAAKDMIRLAGHGKLLEGIASAKAQPGQGTCEGCGGIMDEPCLYKGRCIMCWHRETLRLKSEKN